MISIEGYSFQGPFLESITNFEDIPAVYVILDLNQKKIDVGETDELKTRLIGHKRRNCWKRNCGEKIFVAFLAVGNEESRRTIEGKIRNSCAMLCGVA